MKNDVIEKEVGLSVPKKDCGGRFRNFATVVYPESAPENWKEIFSDYKIPSFISPLHDQDFNIQGEAKKPHYHVMIMFEGKKSFEQVQTIFDSIGGVGCELVNSVRGYARYLCHLDNPEKHQYNTDEVIPFGGADYYAMCSLAVDKYKAIGEIMDYCNNEGIISFAYLCLYAKEYRMDWFRILCDSGAFVIKEYLKSLQWEEKSNLDKTYN